MQHLAVLAGSRAPQDADKFPVHTADVACPRTNCRGTYHLYSPVLETDEVAIKAQTEFLRKDMGRRHPVHVDVIYTPDRPE
jgi:hypothetical protein